MKRFILGGEKGDDLKGLRRIMLVKEKQFYAGCAARVQGEIHAVLPNGCAQRMGRALPSNTGTSAGVAMKALLSNQRKRSPKNLRELRGPVWASNETKRKTRVEGTLRLS